MTLEPGSPAWLAERREGITSTDIPSLLGISPWRSEGDVAREKYGDHTEDPDAATARRFRLGQAMEDIIAAEEELEHGVRLRHVRRIVHHPTLDWARTSLDFERVGERCIVEAKSSTSRDWDDGLPEYVEAQVRWQMGVARYPRAHVAALRYGSTLACFDLEHDEATFDGLVSIAQDFRRRLVAGGPFGETRESVKRKWRDDDGTEMAADAELDEAVQKLAAVRERIRLEQGLEDALVAAVQDRMGPASVLEGSGYRITWKRAKDSEVTDWKLVANDALPLLESELAGVITSLHTATRPGSRRFIVRMEHER